jgi:hypothetical protein
MRETSRHGSGRIRAALRWSVAVAIVATVAACGGAPASVAPSDPYQLLADSSKATWDPIQLNLGMTVTGGATSITVDPADVALVIDQKAGKGGLHLSLDGTALGATRAALDAVGIEGDRIDADFVFDGQGLYGRGDVLPLLVRTILPPTQAMPAGDLHGWLKFGTREEFAALMGIAGSVAAPAASAAPSTTPARREQLESMGVTMKLEGSETRDGRAAHHVTFELDADKLLASAEFSALPPSQQAQMRQSVGRYAVSGDVWFEATTGRAIEVSMHMAGTGDAKEVLDMRVIAKDPDGSVSLESPPSSIEVPLSKAIQRLMTIVSGGAVG